MRRDRRAVATPARSRRCVATGANTACTSSGITMSRPASMAQARAARTRPWPARGLRPNNTSVRWRVLAISVCTYSSRAGATCTRCAAACSSRTPSGLSAGVMPESRSRRSPSASSARSLAASGITQRDAHQEPVELRFRQAERAELLEGILRGDHEERIRQAVGGHVDADLALFHGLEQRALRLGAGAVHFVRQQQLREHRALSEREAAAGRVEHRHADDVRGQQVAGELHALPGEPQHLRERVRERGLADAGHVFDEQVAARQQAGEREAHGLGLAEDDAVERGQGGGERGVQGGGGRVHGPTISCADS